MLSRSRLAGWVSAAALAGAAGLTAQDQGGVSPDAQARPTFRTEANYVRVDVFPTRDGQPVADLGPGDFEILDQGVPQRIEQFEYIRVRGGVPQEARREPNTVAESREMLQDPRARVFVLLLDVAHVNPGSSRTIRTPLVEMLDDLIGADDLVAVMTPGMSAADLTFARRTTTIQGILDREWWGTRDRMNIDDPVERQYMSCYPPDPRSRAYVSPLAQELIDRRREKMTLDALDDLVGFLRGVREERKAILVITEGWRLFGPNPALLTSPDGRPPSLPPIGFDPGTGRVTTSDPAGLLGPRSECDRDRMALANLDSEQQFLRMLDAANRANASFYPVDPRGLVVFDSPIGPDPPPPPEVDAARLRARIANLRMLADATDGLAVVSTNNISGMLARVVTDLSAYYLLGYYATGVEMDGKFHRITVRVKRPGVEVRARRGYLAPSPDEVRLADAAAAPGSARPTAEAAAALAFQEALGSVARFSREFPLRVQAAAGWQPDGAARFWVVGESGLPEEWKDGGVADVALTTGDGEILATTRTNIPAGARSFRAGLTPTAPLAPGPYALRVRARGAASSSLPASDVVNLALAAPPGPVGALFVRRGPATGNREVATADLRFRRSERLRVDVVGGTAAAPAARLLDRAGQPLAIPLDAAVREDADGTRWVTAELTLAPLAAGDYVIEVSVEPAGDRAGTGSGRIWAGFRVVP